MIYSSTFCYAKSETTGETGILVSITPRSGSRTETCFFLTSIEGGNRVKRTYLGPCVIERKGDGIRLNRGPEGEQVYELAEDPKDLLLTLHANTISSYLWMPGKDREIECRKV